MGIDVCLRLAAKKTSNGSVATVATVCFFVGLILFLVFSFHWIGICLNVLVSENICYQKPSLSASAWKPIRFEETVKEKEHHEILLRLSDQAGLNGQKSLRVKGVMFFC